MLDVNTIFRRGHSYRKGIKKIEVLRPSQQGLKAVKGFLGFGSAGRRISVQQYWTVQVAAGRAEMLNTKKQSRGLKQATQKRRKKGKEWKGKSCDSKQGNNVLFVVTVSYPFYRKSRASASFQAENTSTISSKNCMLKIFYTWCYSQVL